LTSLIYTVKVLYNSGFLYFSDLVIHLENGQCVHGHRFVLAARSDHWGVEDLSKVSELDVTGKQHTRH